MSTAGWRRVQRVVCAAALLSLHGPAAAELWPKLETGVGAAAAALPTYRGSSNYGVVALPFPYIIYRGENLRLNRRGARVQALTWDSFSLGFSGAITLPGHGGEDPARDGMPALDPTLEVGPSLDWSFHSADTAWCLCVPIRFGTATDAVHWRSVGWLAHPQLRVQRLIRDGDSARIASMSFGPKFADRRYHAYFYEVQPQFATATRPAFDAVGGYSGLGASMSFGVRRDRWGAGVTLSGDWLEGAAFEDSPLVKSHTSVTAGVWLTYRLWSVGSADDAGEVRD
ncbi:MAG: MipA/OmpV family protein [Burkholderiales bacterium]